MPRLEDHDDDLLEQDARFARKAQIAAGVVMVVMWTACAIWWFATGGQ